MQNVIENRIFSVSRAYIEFCSDNFETIGGYIAAHDLFSISQAATAIKVNANLTGLLELAVLAAKLEDYCVLSDWKGVVETYNAMQSTVNQLAQAEPLAVPVRQIQSVAPCPVNVKLVK